MNLLVHSSSYPAGERLLFFDSTVVFYSNDRRRSFYFGSQIFVSNIDSKKICNSSKVIVRIRVINQCYDN